jgi:hypothetical protein
VSRCKSNAYRLDFERASAHRHHSVFQRQPGGRLLHKICFKSLLRARGKLQLYIGRLAGPFVKTDDHRMITLGFLDGTDDYIVRMHLYESVFG